MAIEARRAGVDDVDFIDLVQRIVDARGVANTSGLAMKLLMRRRDLACEGRVESKNSYRVSFK